MYSESDPNPGGNIPLKTCAQVTVKWWSAGGGNSNEAESFCCRLSGERYVFLHHMLRSGP